MYGIPDGEKWLWTPAQPDRTAKRQMIALQQQPELYCGMLPCVLYGISSRNAPL